MGTRPVAVASVTGLALTAVVSGAANAAGPVAAGDLSTAPSTIKASVVPTTVSVPDVAWTPAEDLAVVAEAPAEEVVSAPIQAEPASRDDVRADIATDNTAEQAGQNGGAQAASGTEAADRQAAINAAGNDIVAIAMSLLGIPYVWGGTTPAGFDCSGFTQYVYAQAGISIPRTSGEQGYAGTMIYDINQAQPGDLVWHAYGHVGIYAGNGMVIEATTPGDVSKIQPIWGYDAFIRIAH
ncbi:C40 family peptidase [Schaalia sp. 19OD2882]|nr:C40 family peptidase [Schaalia sp. 19OD2882]